MIVALIKENLVVGVYKPSSDDEYQAVVRNFPIAIDITDQYPQPQVGWLFDGTNIIDPEGHLESDWRITKLAMLQRFTVPERLALLTYVGANPVSVPAVLLQNIMVASYVDLSRPDTVAGLGYLVSFGIITQDRATLVLTTIPQKSERPITY